MDLSCALPCSAVAFSLEDHGRFIAPSGRLLAVKDAIRRGGQCLVACVRGYPQTLIGWAAVDSRKRVVWCYTKPGLYRRHGLMTALLLAMGVDVSRPTPCLFWSPDAEAIAACGYHLFPVAQRRSEHARNAEAAHGADDQRQDDRHPAGL